MTAPTRLLPEGRDPAESLNLLHALRSGDWLDSQVFPDLQFAVPGLISEGATLYCGSPKIGKSWSILDVLLAVASGGRAFGKIAVGPARPVLYLALEDSERRLQDRCRKLLDGDPIPPLFHFLTRVEPGTVFATVQAWLDGYDLDARPLIVVDTLGRVMPPTLPGESTYQRDYRIGAALKRLVDDFPGSSLVVVHHDRKADSADFVDGVSGTNGLAGALDTVIVLSRNRHESVAVLKVTGRDVPEGEYALTVLDGIRWTLDGPDLETAGRKAEAARLAEGLGDQSIDVLEYVNERPEGVTPKDVEIALDLTAARVYLDRLEKSGRIVKLRRGSYGPAKPLLLPLQVLQPDPPDSHSVLRGNGQHSKVTVDTEVTPVHRADYE